MDLLSDNQVDIINDILIDNGVEHEPLQNSISEFGRTELKNTQETTIYLLTLKLIKMKRVTGITGIISSILVLLGVLFKLLHWPGDSAMLVIGVVLISLLVLPLMMYMSIVNQTDKANNASSIFGYGAAVVLTLGALFKIMHWPGAAVIANSGFILLVFVFMPIYMIKAYRTSESKMLAISKTIMIIAGIILLWSLGPIRTTDKGSHDHNQTERLSQE